MSFIVNPYSVSPSFTGLLDTYTGAAAAYSVRRLSGSYSGAALRVRRSSDSTESDIGFDSTGNLDESALTSFVGANNGFVTKWYDQTGNSRDASNSFSAGQPRIVSSGTVTKVNGVPSVHFRYDGSTNTALNPASSTGFLRNVTGAEAYAVVKSETTSTSKLIYAHNRNAASSLRFGITDHNVTANRFGISARRLDAQASSTTATIATDHGTANQYLLTTWADYGGGTVGIRQNAGGEVTASLPSSGNTSDTNSNSSGIGYFPIAGNYFEGHIQELVIYASTQASRTSIEGNINTYYAIY